MLTFVFYSFIEIFVLSFFYLGMKMNNNQRKINIGTLFVVVSFVILAFVIMFRNIDVGKDYKTYYDAVLRVKNGVTYSTDGAWLSIGFFVLVKLVTLLNLPDYLIPIVVVWIITIITLYVFFKIFIELSSRSTLSLYIFLCFCLYFQMMNQFRQMFAISITFMAYKYIDKSIVRYMGLIMLASLFHSSALIMIPVFFLVRIRLNYKIILTYFSMATLALFFYKTIVRLLGKTSYGAIYLGWSAYDISLKGSAVINFAVRIILLIICLSVYKEVIKKNKKNEILYHMVIICTILQLFTLVSYLYGRMTTYFFVYYILLLPEVINLYRLKISKNSKRIYDVLIYTLLFVYQIVYYFGQGAEAGGYAKYSLIFNNSAYWK